MKTNKKQINWIQVLSVLAILYFFVFSHVRIASDVVRNYDDLYALTTKAILHNDSQVYFKSEISPDYLDYISILDEAMAQDMYSAGEFYEYRYHYMIDADDVYHVTLTIHKPRLYRKLFAKARVKKIANCFRGLGSDYEKVKAVHDYIVTYNSYRRIMGGSYRTLCTGNSACNGYALAFYEIMTELGIPVTNEAGGDHMWNTVCVDGKWYNIDLTWDDPDNGSVNYDYFLKCDADWVGHVYGDSNAESSLPVTGKSAKEYYRMVPNHKIARVFLYIFWLAVAAVVIYFVTKVLPEKKAREKRRQEELLEKTLRQNQELMRLDREMQYYDE